MQESLVLFNNCVVAVDSSDVTDACAGLFSISEGQIFDLAKYIVSSTRYEYSIQYIVSYDTIHCYQQEF